MTVLTIEKGIQLDIPNPDWDRKFKVIERKETDGFIFWRCEWTGPDPNPSGDDIGWKFVGFGAVHHKKSKITDAWVLSTMKGKPQEKGGLIQRGMRQMEMYQCGKCKEYVVFKEKRTPVAQEVVQIERTCPACGDVEVDVID